MTQTKTDFVRFRVEPRLRQLLERKADAKGVTVSEFARDATMNALLFQSLEDHSRPREATDDRRR